WAFLRAAERLEEGWPASRALRESFSAWAARSALLESDLAPLVHLAPVLGLSEGGDQARHLRWARSQLEVKLAGARQRLPEVARLCRALGGCGGLILALLLYEAGRGAPERRPLRQQLRRRALGGRLRDLPDRRPWDHHRHPQHL